MRGSLDGTAPAVRLSDWRHRRAATRRRCPGAQDQLQASAHARADYLSGLALAAIICQWLWM